MKKSLITTLIFVLISVVSIVLGAYGKQSSVEDDKSGISNIEFLEQLKIALENYSSDELGLTVSLDDCMFDLIDSFSKNGEKYHAVQAYAITDDPSAINSQGFFCICDEFNHLYKYDFIKDKFIKMTPEETEESVI